MKFALFESVPYDALTSRLPAELRGPLPPRTSDTYSLIVFPAGRVVHSGLATKATRRLPPDTAEPTIAVATSCTVEAQAVLRAAGVFLVERKP
jgi:hypothetical protein